MLSSPMSPPPKTVAALLLTLLLLLPISFLYAEWPSTGVNVTPNNHPDYDFAMVADRLGGVYIGWFDRYNDGGAPVQRVDRDGNLVWGDPISVVDVDEYGYLKLMNLLEAPGEDVYVTYDAIPNDSIQYRAGIQRLSPDGERLWGETGVEVAPGEYWSWIGDFFRNRESIVSDGAGGVIVAYNIHMWGDENEDLFALATSHVAPEGTLDWSARRMSPWSGTPYSSKAVSDSLGGAIVLYSDQEANLYASHINSEGEVDWLDNPPLFGPDLGFNGTGYCFTNRPNWAPGETMVVVKSVRQYYQIHVGTDGRSVYPDHARLITTRYNPESVFYEFPIENGHVYLPVGNSFEMLRLYKLNEQGEHLFGEEGLMIDNNPLICGPFYSIVKLDSTFIFTYGISLVGACFQRIGFNGEFTWGDSCGHPVNEYQRLPSEIAMCQTSPDTLMMAWFVGPETRIMAMQVFSDGRSAGYEVSVDEEVQCIDERSLYIESVLPNPSNASFSVRVSIPYEGSYTFQLFNIEGRLVHSDRVLYGTEGTHSWSCSNHTFASGVYFLRLIDPKRNKAALQKIAIIR